VNEPDLKRVEAHLQKTFSSPTLTVRPRKQKDSAEVYMGDEFLGVIYEDEDEAGSFLFEMAILAEDLA